jgi:hypothetical protein
MHYYDYGRLFSFNYGGGPFFGLPVLVAFSLLYVALAIGNGFIARQLGRSVVLWVLLSLIPIINYFFFVYLGYAVILFMLRRLNAIAERMGVVER